MSVDYTIQILQYDFSTSALTVITPVLNPMQLDSSGTILEFSKQLSDYGQCHFRISAYDNMLTEFGDVLVPHQYHVRILRNGMKVWQGSIIENPKRNSQYIDILAAEYEWYLQKMMINRSSNDPVTGTADGIYRIFSSGTMSTAVTNIINETITNFAHSSILGGMSVGTIENPNYPPNMTDSTGAALTGAWSFSSTLQLQFDYQSVLYVLKQFGILSFADFYLNEDLSFDFKKFYGRNKSESVSFYFFQKSGQAQNNVVDYNLARLGQQTINHLYGIATDINGTVLHQDQADNTSITTYGLMEGVAAYADVKDAGILRARVGAELPLVSTPTPLNATVVLNETTAYPLGLWDIGDIVNIQVQNKGVTFNDNRRVVAASVRLNNTGREYTTVQTNIVQPWQFALATANGS